MENQTSRLNQQMLVWAILGMAIIAAFGLGTFVRSGFSWGEVAVRQAPSITVSGYAELREQNQIARFTAGVSETDPDKQTAVDAVNSEMNAIIEQVKNFGIAEEDIQTQNLSIYEMEPPVFETMRAQGLAVQPEASVDGGPSESESVWQASNSIEIILRDVDRAGELTDLLAGTGATNVYGPQFSLDDREIAQDTLLQAAIENAREKANRIAESSGRRLGAIENVVEGSGGYGPIYPMYAMDGRGGALEASVEPGSTEVSKTVTVTFSLK